MGLSNADNYYLKALDYYPYNMEFAIENLNYALGYDDEHAPSNCMLGKIYMYQLKDYHRAGKCFYTALECDKNYTDTYKYYSLLRIWQGEYKRAQSIINRGMTIIGMDKSVLLTHNAIIHECMGDYKQAKRVLSKAKLFSIDKHRLEKIDVDLSRLKEKIKSLKSTKKSKKRKPATI